MIAVLLTAIKTLTQTRWSKKIQRAGEEVRNYQGYEEQRRAEARGKQ